MNRQARQETIAYLLSGFPRLSETFILHEIIELERQGLRLIIFPLKNGDAQAQHEVARIKSPVVYVPVKINWGFVIATLRAILFLFMQRPFRFLRVVSHFLLTGKKERHFNILQSFWRWLWLCRELQNARIDRLHAHFAHDPTTMAYWIWRLLDQPYSFTAHAKDIYCYSQSWLQKKIYHARFVVTCTEFNRNYLQQISLNGTPIHRLYHGLNVQKFISASAPKSEKPLILAVGRLTEKKGFPVLLEACALLRDEDFNFSCEIVGDGPQREALQEKIHQLHLQNFVSLRGALTHAQVLGLYQTASVFVMPSFVAENGDRDGIPNVILEAMAMEVPVIASRISGIPEAIEHGQTGLLVDEKNAAQLAKAIKQILGDSALANQLRKAARQKVANTFSLQSNIQNMKTLLLA